MSAIKNSEVDTSRAFIAGNNSSTTTSWSDLDKTRLYSIGKLHVSTIEQSDFKSYCLIFVIGTGIYSGLTVVLHPLTVLKIRKQTGSIVENSGLTNIRQYYRGLGVVLSMAIPARIIYISSLEFTRETAEQIAKGFVLNPPQYWPLSQEQSQNLLPFVTPFSGGVAGGVAALSSQLVVVPMDVISQKQMVAENPVSARQVTKGIISTVGWRGLYRGFGLSIFTSLPAGSIWWATYAGSKDQLLKMSQGFDEEHETKHTSLSMARAAAIQVVSAFNAAFAAAILTQPLDTIKTRLQVLETNSASNTSVMSIAKELAATSKLYQGLMPRIAHMAIWGSVLSSAYEYLKVVSRKDECSQ